MRVETLDDHRGKKVKKDTLFLNFYDFYTKFHDSHKNLFWCYPQVLWKLEMTIRKKWKCRDLLKINIVFKKYKEEDDILTQRSF